MPNPQLPRLRAPRRLQRRAGELIDLLGASGLTVEPARFGRTASWVFASGPADVEGEPEAVFCESEGDRDAIELARPDLIGKVWTAHPSPDRAWADGIVRRYRPEPIHTGTPRVGVIGYDLKFFRLIAEDLERTPGIEVMIDEWPRFEVNDPAVTAEVIERADVVVAEWCGPNAVEASRSKRTGQRLIVRLHRFELEREHWRNVDIDAVDVVVAVGEHYRRLVVERTGWPEEKVVVVPNYVDTLQLDRPKLGHAEFSVGMLGAMPWRKRPDRALEVVEGLRAIDPRFRLRIKSDRPERHRWIWEDPDHRATYERFFTRLEVAGEAVAWEPAGPDVARWFRSIGFILSPSDDESFHLAPAEGMASGSLPVVWDWAGSETVYGRHWIVSSVPEAIERMPAMASDRARLVEGARREVEAYRLETVLDQWKKVLFG